MHPVLQHALEDTGLQRRLVAARTDDALVELLRELDLAADPRGEIEAARRALPGSLATVPPPAQWLPVRLLDACGGDGPPEVEWHHFGFARLTEPFFEESMAGARRLPAQALLRVRTRIDALLPFSDAGMPDGLVFHMSRCGSTLVAQMLAAIERVTVIAEAPVFDAALRMHLHGHLSREHMRGLAGALLRKRHPGAEAGVIKLDAWHAPRSGALCDLFPEAGAVFLHRDPTEVLVSHARKPGLHAIPGALPLTAYGLDADDSAPREDHAARVMAWIMQAGVDAVAAGALRAIDYASLPGALTGRILPAFGIIPEARDLESIARAGARYSKDPSRAFAADSADKRAAAPPELIARIEAFALPEIRDRLLALEASGAVSPE